MTIKQANELLGKRITVRHKVSGERWTITLKSRIRNTVVYWTDGGGCFVVTPVELVQEEKEEPKRKLSEGEVNARLAEIIFGDKPKLERDPTCVLCEFNEPHDDH